MTESPEPLLVESQGPDPGLGRSLSSVDVLVPGLLRQGLASGFRGAQRSRVPSRLLLQPNTNLPVAGKNPFNTQ